MKFTDKRFRSISAAANEIKLQDSNSSLTESAIRTLVKDNKINYITIGSRKKLIDMNELYDFLEASGKTHSETNNRKDIHKINF